MCDGAYSAQSPSVWTAACNEMNEGVAVADFHLSSFLWVVQSILARALETMLKVLSPVLPAGKVVVLSLVSGKKAGNQSAAVLGTGRVALGWPAFSAECFPVPAGNSSQSAL